MHIVGLLCQRPWVMVLRSDKQIRLCPFDRNLSLHSCEGTKEKSIQ